MAYKDSRKQKQAFWDGLEACQKKKKSTPTKTPTKSPGWTDSYLIAKLVDRALSSQEKHQDFQDFFLLIWWGMATIFAHPSV